MLRVRLGAQEHVDQVFTEHDDFLEEVHIVGFLTPGAFEVIFDRNHIRALEQVSRSGRYRVQNFLRVGIHGFYAQKHAGGHIHITGRQALRNF